MQTRQAFLDLFPDFHYGLGIFAERYKGLDIRQHGGNVYGWGAYLMWVPEERFVDSILGNTTYYLRAAGCSSSPIVRAAKKPPCVAFSMEPGGSPQQSPTTEKGIPASCR